MTLKELIVSVDYNESLQLINSLTGEPLTSITSYNTSINNMNDPKLYIADYYNKEVKYICDCIDRHTLITLVDKATNSPITEITTLEESENNPDDKMKSILPFYNCEIVEIFPTVITKTINNEDANNSLRYNTYIVNIVIKMED